MRAAIFGAPVNTNSASTITTTDRFCNVAPVSAWTTASAASPVPTMTTVATRPRGAGLSLHNSAAKTTATITAKVMCQGPTIPGAAMNAAAGQAINAPGSHNALAVTVSRCCLHTSAPAMISSSPSPAAAAVGIRSHSSPALRLRDHASISSPVVTATATATMIPATSRAVAAVTTGVRDLFSTPTADDGDSITGVNSTSASITSSTSRSPSTTPCWASVCVRFSGRPSMWVRFTSPGLTMPFSSGLRSPSSPPSSAVCNRRTRESTTAATDELAGSVTSCWRPANSTATLTCSARRT